MKSWTKFGQSGCIRLKQPTISMSTPIPMVFSQALIGYGVQNKKKGPTLDFQSTAQGEIHGIGFDVDDTLSAGSCFKLYGTQAWGIRDYDNYAGWRPLHR